MASVLISLVGGRTLPNILLTFQLKPDYLYFIVSRDSMGKGGDYDKTLSALPGNLRLHEPFVVNPYALQETIECCKEIVQSHKEDKIVFNLTSGSKIMAFGAYDAAKEFRQERENIEVCYLAGSNLFWFFKEPDKPEPVNISLKQYFESYGWNVSWKGDDVSDKFKLLTRFLVEHLPISLLRTLRENDKGSGKRTCKCESKKIDDSEYVILKELEKLGFISNVQRNDKTTSWTINSNKDGIFLLHGKWLEYHVYQVASVLKDSRGKPLFDECGWSVEDSQKGETDFVGIFGGQMILASCKTDKNLKRDWFEELHSRTEQLGKGMCSSLLISTVSKKSRSYKDLEDMDKWSKERQIVLVLAEYLPKLPAILSKIVSADRQAEPLEIPYFPRI